MASPAKKVRILMDAELEPDLAKELAKEPEKGGGGRPPSGGQPVAGGQPAAQPQRQSQKREKAGEPASPPSPLSPLRSKILMDTGEEPPPSGAQPQQSGQQPQAGSQAPAQTQQLLDQEPRLGGAAKILLDTGEPLPSKQQPSQPSQQGGSERAPPRRSTVVPEWELQERAEEEKRYEEEARRELEGMRDRGREILVAFDTAVAQLEEKLRREGKCVPPSITRLREMIDERARELMRANPWLTFDWARMVAAAELADKGILKLDEVKRQLTVESPVQYRAVALVRGQSVELPEEWDRWDERRRAEWLHDLLKRWGADSAVIAVASRDAFGNVKVERQLSTVTLQQLDDYLHPKQTFYVKVLPAQGGAEERMEVPPFEEWVKQHPEYAGLPEDVKKQYYSVWIMGEAVSRGYSKIWTGSGWADVPRSGDIRVTALQAWTPEGAKWMPVQVFSEWRQRAEGSGGFLGGAAAGLAESLSFGLLQPPWKPPAPAAQVGGEVVPLYWQPQGVQHGTQTAVGSREAEAAEKTGLAKYWEFGAGETAGQQAGEWLKAYAFGKLAQTAISKLVEAPPIEQILEKARAGQKLSFWERLKLEAWIHLPEGVYEKIPEIAEKLGLVEERYRMPEKVELQALEATAPSRPTVGLTKMEVSQPVPEGPLPPGARIVGPIAPSEPAPADSLLPRGLPSFRSMPRGIEEAALRVKVVSWQDIPPELAEFIMQHSAEFGAFPVNLGGKTVWVPWAKKDALVLFSTPEGKYALAGLGDASIALRLRETGFSLPRLAYARASGVVDVDALKAALMGGVPLLQTQQLLSPALAPAVGPAYLTPAVPVATALAPSGVPALLVAGALKLGPALLDLPKPAAILGSVRLEGLGDLPAVINASKGGATLTLDAPLPSGGGAPVVVKVEGGRAEAEVYAPKGGEGGAAETAKSLLDQVSKELGVEPGEVRVKPTVPLIEDERVKEVVLVPLEGELRDEVEKLLEKKGIDRWPDTVIFVPAKPEVGAGLFLVPVPGLAGWTWIRTPFGEVPGVELAPGVIAVPVTAPIVAPAISTIQAQQLRLDLQTGQVCCPPPSIPVDQELRLRLPWLFPSLDLEGGWGGGRGGAGGTQRERLRI
jgi:hypothetical protein